MPSTEGPSMNSSRVQRAYRINNIENGRLQCKLKLLEKEKVHRVRLSNQDIRLISVTLDYINSCSGHSPEALSPEENITQAQREDDDKPCFLYGERIISRKRRRVQRPQSAVGMSRRAEADDAHRFSTLSARPQSSPARGKTFVTSVTADDDTSSVTSTDTRFSSRTDRSQSSSAPSSHRESCIDETTEITKKLLRANLNSQGTTRRRGSLHQKELSRRHSKSVNKLEMLNRRRTSVGISRDSDETESPLASRHAGIMDILNKKGPALSAREWKAHLQETKHSAAGPMSSTAQQQNVMNIKMTLNNNQKHVINGKVKGFVEKLANR